MNLSLNWFTSSSLCLFLNSTLTLLWNVDKACVSCSNANPISIHTYLHSYKNLQFLCKQVANLLNKYILRFVDIFRLYGNKNIYFLIEIIL